jgi:hypothetical protein
VTKQRWPEHSQKIVTRQRNWDVLQSMSAPSQRSAFTVAQWSVVCTKQVVCAVQSLTCFHLQKLQELDPDTRDVQPLSSATHNPRSRISNTAPSPSHTFRKRDNPDTQLRQPASINGRYSSNDARRLSPERMAVPLLRRDPSGRREVGSELPEMRKVGWGSPRGTSPRSSRLQKHQ